MAGEREHMFRRGCQRHLVVDEVAEGASVGAAPPTTPRYSVELSVSAVLTTGAVSDPKLGKPRSTPTLAPPLPDPVEVFCILRGRPICISP